MDDPQTRTIASTRPEVCDQIGRAVGSLWQRRSGVKPANVDTEYVGDVVRCRIEQGDEPKAEGETIPRVVYDREAKAAVAKLTGRTVVGYVGKPVAAGDPAKNAFILETATQKH
jgi:hypothetical protein